jgi:hypothetical protein
LVDFGVRLASDKVIQMEEMRQIIDKEGKIWYSQTDSKSPYRSIAIEQVIKANHVNACRLRDRVEKGIICLSFVVITAFFSISLGVFQMTGAEMNQDSFGSVAIPASLS